MTIREKLIILLFSITLATNIANAEEEISTHVYDHYAVRSASTQMADGSYKDKIIILQSEFKPNPVRGDLFKIPSIGKTFWEISAKDLTVSEESCLAIDATLCNNFTGSEKNTCYSNCVTNGPKFVAFDASNEILYIDAGSNISGSAGIPRFIFAADIKNKKIKYLNTFVAPYTAYLSPNGKYLALDSGWNEISICNTDTGNYSEVHTKTNIHGSKVVKWLVVGVKCYRTA